MEQRPSTEALIGGKRRNSTCEPWYYALFGLVPLLFRDACTCVLSLMNCDFWVNSAVWFSFKDGFPAGLDGVNRPVSNTKPWVQRKRNLTLAYSIIRMDNYLRIDNYLRTFQKLKVTGYCWSEHNICPNLTWKP